MPPINSDIHVGDLTGYISRLNTTMTTLASPAELAWDMETIEDFENDIPTVLCYPSDQFSTQTGESPVHRQAQKFSVTNLVICSLTDLPNVLKDLRATIIGWAPDSYSEQFKFTHRNIRFAGPMELKSDYIWWEELYESSKSLRVT